MLPKSTYPLLKNADSDEPPRVLLLTAGRVPLLLTASGSCRALYFSTEKSNCAPPENADKFISLNGKNAVSGKTIEPGVSTPVASFCQTCGANEGVRLGAAACARCLLKNYLAKEFVGQKLAPAGFEKIRMYFALPADISQMKANDARALLFLLTLFIRDFSFETQNMLIEDDLIEWCCAQPTLPKIFAKIIKTKKKHCRTVEMKERENLSVNGKASCQVRRVQLSPKQFTEVAVRQGLYCYWCGTRVVREAQIPPAARAGKTETTVFYYDGSVLREAAPATIDHLVRLIDGGTNDPANLVIACAACNAERERVTVAYGRPFARRQLPCSNCGGRFFHPDWGCCSICGATFSHRRNWFLLRLREKLRRSTIFLSRIKKRLFK